MITQDENGRWSNHAEDIIDIVPYDRRWVEQFADERRAIRDCVDAAIPLVIEHFGSTAIPGAAAKPIIDIMIGADRRHWPATIQALKRMAYVHWEDNPDADREFLVKGMPPFGTRRTHHVHINEVSGPLWERLLFRDYLQSHAEDRSAYTDLKVSLAVEYPEDREAYTRGKDALVAEIMARARSWRCA
ncbi:GrpB family protein [Methylococcus sp. EFPC2]|uniref:GrpB family protein n=1 Tax=Methylococcus sp. EFPC2 TaxID=2812648 RepID=UPI0019673B74|nr:GrpB family protein [Methylococcus sp. EFPC2]QSA97305.1 GrpB family protein [Methylococcus sp. EFPC2]